jgi:thiamine biosynthesis protein ThiI
MNFENALIKNIKTAINGLGVTNITRAQSTITIEPMDEDYPFEEALLKIQKVFGIAAFCRAAAVEKDMDEILKQCVPYLKNTMAGVKTFKVEAKRADKKFPLTSPEISRLVGGELLKSNHHLKVDVHNPEIVVTVEVRDKWAFIRAGQLHGAGGMPVGTGGRASILISGGIDSPVAAWMMAKRGIELDAIHFASPPYTSIRAEQKVKKLLSRVAAYSGPIRMGIVPFTEIQQTIADNCPEEYFTLIMRRMMMRISERLAKKRNSLALITGESVGQVASQTLPALVTTDIVVGMPVFRPLIGMDKDEIVEISRKIDTFEISIEPYEDCCTVFTPKHPRTRPTIEQCEKAEELFDFEPLIEQAVENTVFEVIE